MPARMIERSPLEGRFVRLEPMAREHLPELYSAIGRPEVFAGGYGGGPAGLRGGLAGFIEFAETYYAWDAGLPFLVRSADGVVVGTSTLGSANLPGEQLELGWTAYSPDVWGTFVNPETKLLLLGAAFAHGFGRVSLNADVLNAQSRAAILKLGASFEGVKRRDKRRADGSWRDTALHSILIDEWPGVRARLEERLAAR